jgi:hypothetical protein
VNAPCHLAFEVTDRHHFSFQSFFQNGICNKPVQNKDNKTKE